MEVYNPNQTLYTIFIILDLWRHRGEGTYLNKVLNKKC